MRRLLLTLPFALLPLASSASDHAHKHEPHEHASLEAHEHGSAQLDVVLDGPTLELQLHSPAMNLLGFEHAAQTAEDQATLQQVRQQLEQPLQLFALNGGDCQIKQQQLYSPLFKPSPAPAESAPPASTAPATASATEHTHAHAKHAEHDDHQHSDIQANYQLACNKPEQLKQVDLAPLFKRFPATQKIQVQLIGPSGQQGKLLSADDSVLSL